MHELGNLLRTDSSDLMSILIDIRDSLHRLAPPPAIPEKIQRSGSIPIPRFTTKRQRAKEERAATAVAFSSEA